MKIEGTQFDRRRKLSIAQRDEIKRLFDSGKWNKTSLAEKFGVTVNAIRFIVDPEMYKKWKENRERRGGEKQYYNAEANTKKMRNYRKYVKYINAYVTKKQLSRWSAGNDDIVSNAMAAAAGLKAVRGE